MRISEIKQIVTDEKVLKCIKCDFWEDEYYRRALSNEKYAIDVDSIYAVLKNAYIMLLNNTKQSAEEKPLFAHSKKIRRLSKLIYGDSLFWAQGTEWEGAIARRNNHTLIQERHDTINFLYERLNLRKKSNNLDIVYLTAKCVIFYDEVVSSEKSTNKIYTLIDLYNHFERIALETLDERKLSYLEYKAIKSAAYLAFKDANTFLNRNKLMLSQVLVIEEKDAE